jgi:hypothetical protein
MTEFSHENSLGSQRWVDAAYPHQHFFSPKRSARAWHWGDVVVEKVYFLTWRAFLLAAF